MLPWRMWAWNMVARTLRCYDDDNSCNCIDDFTNEHLAYLSNNVCRIGAATYAGPMYGQWLGIVRCEAEDFELAAGMDEVVDYAFHYNLWLDSNSAGLTGFTFFTYQLDDPTLPAVWDSDLVTGKHYDGINSWNVHPPLRHDRYDNESITIATDLPLSKWTWCAAYDTAHRSNALQDEFFTLGVHVALYSFVGGVPDPECTCYLSVSAMKVNYLNPVVNSLDRMHMPAAGGVRLVLSGLGFDQIDAELNSTDRYSNNNPACAWNSIVDFIHFEGKQGQGTTTLSRAAGDFAITSDSRIVIQSMPALAAGTYDIRLEKQGVGAAGGIGTVEAYAGDWMAGDNGQASPGVRISFLVGEYVDPPRPPLPTFKWRWIIGGLDVDAYYSPIDICGPDIFWDGRLTSISSLKRSIDEMSGMFNISDVNVEMASHDMHFQKLLAQGYCKNQMVEIAHVWATEPVGWMYHVFHGIVDDNSFQGPEYRALIKDISRKHFRKKIPRYTITKSEWPDAHENAIGMGYPELIGLHAHTTGSSPGSIEAHCVDTVNHRYAAAGGPVMMDQVWSANALQTEGAGDDYTISFDALGRTYIDFNAPQGDKKITFNCRGYSFALWNSTNGYVQNPAYLLLFYIVFICQVPLAFTDLASFDEVATMFDDQGYGEIGRWAGTEIKDADDYLQELLFSFGIKIWPDRYGRFKVGRKDLTNYETDLTIWAQIHTSDPPNREYNLPGAFNFVRARWDYQPAPSLWLGADEKEREDSVEAYGERSEDTWDYPWINSSEFAVQRMAKDFRRLAFGHRKVTFDLPMEFIDKLDIFDNFKLQDPYDLHPQGEGSVGHYYYVTALTYEWMNQKISVEAEDLEWLVSQCFIIGRCEDIANSWENATQWMRFFGYVGSCATNSLPGGSPLKVICPCE